MSGFQFPPPPPPPPKPVLSNKNNQYPQYDGQGRGRGRGRGQGNSNNRGRGGRGSNGFSLPRDQQSHNDRALPTDNAGNYHPSNFTTPGIGTANIVPQQNHQPSQGLPAGSFVNPAFQPPQSAYGQFPTSNSSTSHANGSSRHSHWRRDNEQPQSSSASPARTVVGHKRKLEALRGSRPSQQRSGPPAAPSVPSFGAPILAPLPTFPGQSGPKVSKNRPGNVLGLTPQNDAPDYSSSESDEGEGVDEEAMFADLGTNLTFEHNGAVMSLNSASDLISWRNERLRNFPTRARMAAKMNEKREIGDERKTLLHHASDGLHSVIRGRQSAQEVLAPQVPQNGLSSDAAEPESKLQRAKRELEEQTNKLELLRRQVSQSQIRLTNEQRRRSSDVASDQTKRPTSSSLPPTNMAQEPAIFNDQELIQKFPDADQEQNEILEAVDDNRIENSGDEDGDSSPLSDSSSEVSSDSPSDTDSEDDGPPEEVTSKQSVAQSGTKKILCKYFLASGYCRDGDTCRFKHELPPRSKLGARKDSTFESGAQQNQISKEMQSTKTPAVRKRSLHDRLIEQDQSEEDQLALQAIKHLGNLGFFSA